MSVPQRIAITGASGLIGTALVGHLKSEGHTVQRFVRRPVVAPDEIQWDPKLVMWISKHFAASMQSST